MSESQQRLPRHIGIIMDGNGRWAQARGEERVYGHREGARSVRDVVRASRKLGIKALTLYAFSEQNWSRPAEEVAALMELLHEYVLEEHDEIMDNGIRLYAVGEIDRLPAAARDPLQSLMEESKDNSDMILCLALSYGGREDILEATRKLCRDVQSGRIDADEINEVMMEARLSTALLPPLDLVIRTSGELRLSNFLLWEAAYAEFYFTDLMWPDFRKPQLLEALQVYQDRDRRFGKLNTPPAPSNG